MAQAKASTAPRVTVIDPRQPEKARLRVAAYARVSSDSEDQLNSYLAQVDYYTKFIASKDEWEMVDVYADEGISGLEARNRDDFNRMMEDCRAGKIDRVLCKSISRFARNTKEYIQFVRELLRLGISISFEKENIDTGKMTSEQVAQIYGAFAQMESTNHSTTMRISNRIRMEKGLFVPSTAPYGYRLKDLELEIVPDEADTVRYIYGAYLSGQGVDDIAKELNKLGVTRSTGQGRWYSHTVNYILTNVSYTGDMLWQKTYATETIPFRQVRNHGEKPTYFVTGSHPPIIGREEFQRVQELMILRRSRHTGATEAACQPIYSKHIVCGCCGSVFRKKLVRGKVYWICHKHDKDKSRCQVPRLPETEITAAVLRLYLKLKHDNGGILNWVLGQLRDLREQELRSNQKISDIDREIAHISEQNLVLTRLRSKGYVDPALYLSQQDELGHKLKTLRKLRRRVLESASEDRQIRDTEAMLDYLADGPEWPDALPPDIFDALIQRIIVTENGDLKICLLNGLELPERTERMVR